MATRIPRNLRRSEPDPRVLFFRSFLEKPREVASIIPSSRFLERRVVRTAAVQDASLVVELGPGTGGTTRALLAAMPADAKLLAIEINPRLARAVREHIRDPRLIVHQGSAEQIREALDAHGLNAPTVVTSGIPFSQLPRPMALRILESVREVLSPEGRFVAYQARDRVEVLGRRVFGRPSSQLEVRNVPPMRVYRFEKAARVEPRRRRFGIGASKLRSRP